MAVGKPSNSPESGDSACGKTCLLDTWENDRYEETPYRPTVFHTTMKQMEVPDRPGETFIMSMWDTAGQEEYVHARTIAYPNTHVLLIAFDVSNHASLDNVKEVWSKELERPELVDVPVGV